MTDQGPCTYWRWHHQTPRHEHTERTIHAEDQASHIEAQTNMEQRNEPQDKPRPYTSRRRQRHTLEPNVHTHDTQDKYLQAHHNVSWWSLTWTESLPDRCRYRPGYLTAGKYPHLPHLFHYGCIGPHSQNSIQNHHTPVKNFTSSNHRILV